MEGANPVGGGIDLNSDDGAVQIEDSAQTILRCIVRKTADVYRAIVVHRHGHRENPISEENEKSREEHY